MKRWIILSLQMTLKCRLLGVVSRVWVSWMSSLLAPELNIKRLHAQPENVSLCQHYISSTKPHWLIIPWDRTWIWQLVKAAFSDFCLPGCDISKRNEVEKSSSFESSWLLIPTVVRSHGQDRKLLLNLRRPFMLLMRSDQGGWWGGAWLYVCLDGQCPRVLVCFCSLLSIPQLKKVGRQTQTRARGLCALALLWGLVQSLLTLVIITLSWG